MRSLKIGNSPRYLATPSARGFTLLASVIGRSIYRRNTAYSELVRTVSASGAEVARAPATRCRPVATRVEFPRPRLVPAPALFAGPTPRLHAVAHVHGVWRRAGGPARRRCRELRALAPRNDGPVIEIKRRAAALGFAATGIARLDRNPHAQELDRWLADGHAGTMTYLHRQAEQRKDPRLMMPGSTTRCYVDAGPVPERELAQLAGLGWIGKNMMLIHPEIGSFTFIGVVLTDAELAPDLPFEADRCGTCTRCLEACPTQAFVGPRDLDARACISYLTIEHRGAFTGTQRTQVGDWLFGCDVCQDVCPWNVSFARETRDPGFAPRADVVAPDGGAFATMTEAEFDRRYGDTPFTRPGLEGMRRNALVD